MNFNYVNGNGVLVRGAATTNHEIYTVCGSIEAFIEKYQKPVTIVLHRNNDLFGYVVKFASGLTYCVTSIWKR